MEKVKKEDIAKLQYKIAMLEADVECNRTRLDHFVNLVIEKNGGVIWKSLLL